MEVSGIVFNITVGVFPTVRGMIQALAKATNLSGKIISISEKEAQDLFGPLTNGLIIDQQVSNERIKRLLDWHPRFLGFFQDPLCYYETWKALKKIS
jgi:nucleoside-diphosphate-sugar epimerase